MRRRALHAATVAAVLLAIVAPAAHGQGQCQTNGAESCMTQANNTNAISLTITRATRLELSAASITLSNATAGAFDSTFATTSGLTLLVKSNQGWSVTARVTTSSWAGVPLGGSGATPRANKPDADLLWATNPGGPFTPFSTTDAQLQVSGAATAGTVIPLSLRVLYSWVLDTPGVYSIPIQFTITAP